MTVDLLANKAAFSIDNQPITLDQVLRYLRVGGQLEGFLREMLRQFVIERELQQNPDLPVNSSEVEQTIIDFRLQQQLTDPQKFQQWLSANGLTYEGFHQQILQGFQTQKLKEVVTDGKLQEYFAERKPFLDRVILSRIIVADQELIAELKNQLDDGAAFEQLAREYSLMDDRTMNGMVGPVAFGTMPETLQAAVTTAQPGDIVGPIGMEERWGLFRVEGFLPASLENLQIQQSLQEELFERWLTERMQNLPIRIQVGE